MKFEVVMMFHDVSLSYFFCCWNQLVSNEAWRWESWKGGNESTTLCRRPSSTIVSWLGKEHNFWYPVYLTFGSHHWSVIFFLTNFLHHGHGCLIAFRCIYFSHQHTNIALRTILSMFCSSFFEPQMYHYDKSCRAFCYVSKKPWYLSVCSLSNTIGHGFLDDRCYQHFLKLEDIRGSLNITRNIRNHPRRDDILYRLIISAEVAKVMVFQMDNLWMSWRVSWICWSMASNKWVPPTIRNWWSLWDSTLAVFGQFCFYSEGVSRFLFRSTSKSQRSYSLWCHFSAQGRGIRLVFGWSKVLKKVVAKSIPQIFRNKDGDFE